MILKDYESEKHLDAISRLLDKDLAEAYSIFTYRYFIRMNPELCILAFEGDRLIGVIICKVDMHRMKTKRGYIAMLAVEKEYRKQGIATQLVTKAINRMKDQQVDEVVLETEMHNTTSLMFYERLGFVRDKKLPRYYLTGVGAYRLKLFL